MLTVEIHNALPNPIGDSLLCALREALASHQGHLEVWVTSAADSGHAAVLLYRFGVLSCSCVVPLFASVADIRSRILAALLHSRNRSA